MVRTACHKILRVFPGIMVVCILVYVFVMVPVQMFFQRYAPEEAFPQKTNTVFFTFIAACYGFLRVVRFHPVFNRPYLTQLALSPWALHKPLPCGPVHLSGADAVVLGLLALLTVVFPVESRWTLLVVFLAAYAAGLFVSFCMADQAVYISLYVILAPLSYYLHGTIHLTAIVLAGLVGIGLWGVRSYLAQFPWNTPWWNETLVGRLKRDAVNRQVIQWPFRKLAVRVTASLTLWEGAFIGLLVFWWVHVITWGAAQEGFSVMILYPFAIGLIVLMRLLCYIAGYRPPISLLGRLRTGRLVIPGYDQVFLAPAAVALTGIFGPMVLKSLGVPGTLALEMSFALSIFAAVTFPPSVERWHYTGQHRIAPPPRQPTRTMRKRTENPAILNRLCAGRCR